MVGDLCDLCHSFKQHVERNRKIYEEYNEKHNALQLLEVINKHDIRMKSDPDYKERRNYASKCAACKKNRVAAPLGPNKIGVIKHVSGICRECRDIANQSFLNLNEFKRVAAKFLQCTEDELYSKQNEFF